MKNGIKCAATAGVFLAVGIALFVIIQNILTPQDTWPHHKENTTDMLAEIDTLNGSDIQAFFVGASHSAFGVDPMRIYEQSGIVTYNLASSAQRIASSYYLLKESFQDQTPRYVFLEAGVLFLQDSVESFLNDKTPSPNASFRYILDSAKFDLNKIGLARVYSGYFPEEQKLSAFFGALLPIWQYHDRWKELSVSDFALFDVAKDYFLKGYYMTSVSIPAPIDVVYMNELAQSNAADDGWTEQIYPAAGGMTDEDIRLYTPEISQENLSWLLRIKELCEENGAELQLIKLPSCAAPQEYASAWTKIKADMVKGAAAELGIPFVDLLYDVDIGIDWSKDTQDLGKHLNFGGAKKVANFFADYLQNECGLAGQYDESYEKDIPAYDALCKVAELQMASDLSSYFERLSDLDDVTVFLSGSDMELNLSEENRRNLSDFGLRTDFVSHVYRDSFLAVKEGDTIRYEASSNRRLSNAGELRNGSKYTVTSCGWGKELESTIVIDGVDYSLGMQGIDIVVYDNASRLVIDSVVFPTWSAGDQSAVRDLTFDEQYSPLGSFDGEAYLLNYKSFLAEHGARNGV